jgi:hypothetical protein
MAIQSENINPPLMWAALNLGKALGHVCMLKQSVEDFKKQGE